MYNSNTIFQQQLITKCDQRMNADLVKCYTREK